MTTRIHEIARSFAQGLRDRLTAAEFAQVCADNIDLIGTGICASHDHLDANNVMLDAFTRVMGRNPLDSILDDGEEGITESDCRLWGAAWDVAQRRYLSDPDSRPWAEHRAALDRYENQGQL